MRIYRSCLRLRLMSNAVFGWVMFSFVFQNKSTPVSSSMIGGKILQTDSCLTGGKLRLQPPLGRRSQTPSSRRHRSRRAKVLSYASLICKKPLQMSSLHVRVKRKTGYLLAATKPLAHRWVHDQKRAPCLLVLSLNCTGRKFGWTAMELNTLEQPHRKTIVGLICQS